MELKALRLLAGELLAYTDVVLTKAGVMDAKTLREFAALCLPPIKVYTGVNSIQPRPTSLMPLLSPTDPHILLCPTGWNKPKPRQAVSCSGVVFL